MYKIIVHPGRAHRDDLMAVCALLATLDAPVEVLRRDPSSEDLADPATYVVDIGMAYDSTTIRIPTCHARFIW